MNTTVKKEMNKLIKQFPCRFWLFSKGKVYLLNNHHEFLDPEDAPKILIGSSVVPNVVGIRNSNRNPKDRVLYTHSKL